MILSDSLGLLHFNKSAIALDYS